MKTYKIKIKQTYEFIAVIKSSLPEDTISDILQYGQVDFDHVDKYSNIDIEREFDPIDTSLEKHYIKSKLTDIISSDEYGQYWTEEQIQSIEGEKENTLF